MQWITFSSSSVTKLTRVCQQLTFTRRLLESQLFSGVFITLSVVKNRKLLKLLPEVSPVHRWLTTTGNLESILNTSGGFFLIEVFAGNSQLNYCISCDLPLVRTYLYYLQLLTSRGQCQSWCAKHIAVAKMGTKPVEGSLNSLIKPLKILKNFNVWFFIHVYEAKLPWVQMSKVDDLSLWRGQWEKGSYRTQERVSAVIRHQMSPDTQRCRGEKAVFEQQAWCKQTFPAPLRYTTGSDIWVEHHYGKTKQTIFVPPKQDAIQHFVAFGSETKYKQVV